MRTVVLAFAILLLAACSQRLLEAPLRLPEFRLAPGAFGRSLSLNQRLTLEQLPELAAQTPVARQRSLDALLEIDAEGVRLAGFALGQRILTLTWDGTTLGGERHALLPKEVDAGHILRDIQLVYWPAETIRPALPVDWTLEDSGEQRILNYRGQMQVTVHYHAVPRWTGRAELDNRLERYRLLIESSPMAGS